MSLIGFTDPQHVLHQLGPISRDQRGDWLSHVHLEIEKWRRKKASRKFWTSFLVTHKRRPLFSGILIFDSPLVSEFSTFGLSLPVGG